MTRRLRVAWVRSSCSFFLHSLQLRQPSRCFRWACNSRRAERAHLSDERRVSSTSRWRKKNHVTQSGDLKSWKCEKFVSSSSFTPLARCYYLMMSCLSCFFSGVFLLPLRHRRTSLISRARARLILNQWRRNTYSGSVLVYLSHMNVFFSAEEGKKKRRSKKKKSVRNLIITIIIISSYRAARAPMCVGKLVEEERKVRDFLSLTIWDDIL